MLVLHCSIATYARRVGKVEPVYLTDKINKMTSKHDLTCVQVMCQRQEVTCHSDVSIMSVLIFIR